MFGCLPSLEALEVLNTSGAPPLTLCPSPATSSAELSLPRIARRLPASSHTSIGRRDRQVDGVRAIRMDRISADERRFSSLTDFQPLCGKRRVLPLSSGAMFPVKVAFPELSAVRSSCRASLHYSVGCDNQVLQHPVNRPWPGRVTSGVSRGARREAHDESRDTRAPTGEPRRAARQRVPPAS